MQGKKLKTFLKKHWMDILIILVVVALLAVLAVSIGIRFKFPKKWTIFSNYFFTNNGYKKLLTGIKNTCLIAVGGLLIGTVIGTLIAMVKVIPPYKKIVRYAQTVCNIYVAFFRGTPIVVQLLLGYYILLPMMGVSLPEVTSCILIFGLNSGAYISEIMRGGINSVDPGQLEAARAVGLPFATAMLKVVIPQAVKNILPTMGNEFITLIKETSVVSFVGATDLYVAFSYIGSNSYEFMVPYIVMALIYIVLVLAISILVKMMERSLKKSDRSR
jgi:polar amino acid transport system permease protein